MLKGLITFASIGPIENLFSQWESVGLFSYVLPFLLIFALVFGILTKVKLFKENKAINAIIALVIGLMAVQMNFVSAFFAQIFPQIGIALIAILGFFIVIGLFVDPDNPIINWILLGIAAIVFIVVIVQTAGALGVSTGYWWQENWVTVIGIVIVIALVIAVIASSARGKGLPPPRPIWTREK